MNDVTREDVLALAVRADRCGRKTLATNLYAVAELMSDWGGGGDRTIAGANVREMSEDGFHRAQMLGIGVGIGRAS